MLGGSAHNCISTMRGQDLPPEAQRLGYVKAFRDPEVIRAVLDSVECAVWFAAQPARTLSP